MPAIQVQFLGSGDAFGSGGRLQTCIFVRTPAISFLFDIGSSAPISFRRRDSSTTDIGSILLTHLHADHFGGIPIFLIEAQHIAKREKPLQIAGPPSLETRIQMAQEVLYPGSSEWPRSFPVEFIELEERVSTRIDQLSVKPFPVVHDSGAPSYALRVEIFGKTITYSGDTEWTDTLIEAADGADLFICESNYYTKQVKYHLNYRTLMSHREKFSCKRMILTHMGEEMLQEAGNLEVEVAEDGKIINI
jgi:ribonuclease BN (tRNA processing enzyme)